MSGDKPQSKMSKCAWEADKREYIINAKRMVQIAGVLALVVISIIGIYVAFTGVFAQIALWLGFLGILVLAGWTILIAQVALNQARQFDTTISVRGRVIRLGEPPVVDKQLFSRLESLFRDQSCITQELMKAILQLETMAKARQEDIKAARAVLDSLRSKESSLRDSMLALREIKPEAVALFRETFEDVLEGEDRQKRPGRVIVFFLGAFVGALLEVFLGVLLDVLFADRIKALFGT